MTFGDIFRLIMTMLLMVGVFVGAYYFSRFMGKRYGGVSGGKGQGSIELLESRPLGKDQSLVIVRVDGRVLLLGATTHRIELISELSPDFEAENEGQTALPPSFFGVLKDAVKKNDTKGGDKL